jgi:hypothetical protein
LIEKWLDKYLAILNVSALMLSQNNLQQLKWDVVFISSLYRYPWLNMFEECKM